MARSAHGLIKILSWNFPGGTEKNQDDFNTDIRSAGRNLKSVTPDYEAGMLNSQS
jgi:hypothetical protein